MRRCLLPVFSIIYLLCALYVMIPFSIGFTLSGYSGIDSSPNGVPARPLVYRVLMPDIARAVRSAVPAAIEQSLTNNLIHWRDSTEGQKAISSLFSRKPPMADDTIFETAVVLAVVYLSLLAFIAMFYTLSRALFPQSMAYALAAPLLMLQVLPSLTLDYAYMYDFSEMFFSCACFYLLFRQRWMLYLVCFTLATLNKETSIFAVFMYAVWFYPRLPRWCYLSLLCQQLGIYAAIKVALTLYFADTPAVPYTPLQEHLEAFYRNPFPSIALGAGLVIAIAYRWRAKPVFLRGGLWMFAPNWIAFMLLCNPGEYRDFYWSLPVLVLLATHSLIAFSGIADLPILRPRIADAPHA